ncbi:MAG: pilin [Patescibacteria group bacterium]|nr:pilin [Patescibacteria group bacterium]
MKKIITAVSLFVLPIIAFAQQVVPTYSRVLDANSLFGKVNTILNAIIPILISVAVVWLIYAIVKYVVAGNEDDKEVGKSHIKWGVIGLFVILSIWGLVNILVQTFGLNNIVDQNQIPNVLRINQTI